MTSLLIPLANWNIGTILIILFAIVCVGLTALVLSFVFSGKKKEDEDISASNENNL